MLCSHGGCRLSLQVSLEGVRQGENHESTFKRYGQTNLCAISSVLMSHKVLSLDGKTKQLKCNVSEVRRVASVWLLIKLTGYCQQNWGTSVLSPTISTDIQVFQDLSKYRNHLLNSTQVQGLWERERQWIDLCCKCCRIIWFHTAATENSLMAGGWPLFSDNHVAVM